MLPPYLVSAGLKKGQADQLYVQKGLIVWSSQSFSASGTATSAAPLVYLTGTTASQALSLPASPQANQQIIISNQSTQPWTILGNGNNIASASSRTLPAGMGTTLYYSGTQWVSGTASAINPTTFAADTTFLGGVLFGIQSFTASGTAAAFPPFVNLSGTSGGTLSLPASPVAGQTIAVLNQTTQTWTISGNGNNINGASTRSLASTQNSVQLIYNGIQWVDIGASLASSQVFTATMTLASSATLNLQGRYVQSVQTFSTTAQTIAAAGAPGVAWTATAVATPTINLPSSSLTTGQQYTIWDQGGNCGTNNLTISGNGNNINGAASIVINSNYGYLTLRWNGTQWNRIG